jgi:nicotinate-nucleotide adenylyltransferase
MSKNRKKRLGILGGTFDPIHSGHLILAEQLKEELKLQKVIFIPSANPPHKVNHPISPAKDRMKMVKLAIRDNPDFLISDLELKRKGKSYTIDTLTRFAKLYQDSELFFLLGSDAIDELPTWKEPYKIFQKVKVVVALRPGFDRIDPENRFVRRSLVVPINGLNISSTQIREKVRIGKSIRYLVPPGVEKFIRSKRLYRS